MNNERIAVNSNQIITKFGTDISNTTKLIKNRVGEVETKINETGNRIGETETKITDMLNANTLQNLSSNGYKVFPGGFIVQWGSFTLSGNEAKSYNKRLPYPIPFPNACLSIIGSVDSHDVNTTARLTASYVISENSQTDYHVRISSLGLPQEDTILNTDVRWIAIGH